MVTRGPRGSADKITVGSNYGYWTVLGPYYRAGSNNDAFFPCECRCGTKKDVKLRVLREAGSGKKGISCGCYQKEVMATKRRHGVEPGTKEWDLARRLWARYKLTLETFYSMKKHQNNCCAICLVDFDTLISNEIHIDHDHSCCDPDILGKRSLCGRCNRGILCRHCNYGIGNFRENPVLLTKASQYLIKHETVVSDQLKEINE